MTETAQLFDKVLTPHQFHPSIMREYDMRGVVGETLSLADAFALGGAFGTYIRDHGGDTICVGYDGRYSSPDMVAAVIDGLIQVGVKVTDLGLGPSPMVYFALKDRMFDAGLVVTGSHNPSDYNGFKMAMQSGPVFGREIQKIGQIASQGAYQIQSTPGTVVRQDLKSDYVARLLKDLVKSNTTLTIAWDAGNGAVGAVLPQLCDQLPGKHVMLHERVDGGFPAHHPDPTVDRNLHDLIAAVQEHQCDFGVAFDGDGDRIGIVGPQGQIYRCDTLMAIYAADVLEAHPGAPIIGDIKCSGVMFREIERLGGQPVIWKTGHSLIKSKMAEMKAPLAGELSGHIFFNDRYYGFDDALYCAIRLMNAVLDAGEGGLPSLVAHLPVLVNTPELRIEVEEERKFDLAQQIYDHVKGLEGIADYISDIDGIRYDEGVNWWVLRPSNTQNVFVIRFEAENDDAMLALQDSLLRILKPFDLDKPLQKALTS